MDCPPVVKEFADRMYVPFVVMPLFTSFGGQPFILRRLKGYNLSISLEAASKSRALRTASKLAVLGATDAASCPRFSGFTGFRV